MDEKPWWVEDYFGQTTLHPLGLAMVLACGFALVVLPRRYAVWPMIVIACFVAPAQRIAIPLLNFDLLRIMVLFGWTRILVRGEVRGFRWKPLDFVFLAWVVSNVVVLTLSRGTFSDFMNRLGYAYDAVGMYLLFRCLVRDWDDLSTTINGFALFSIPVAIVFLVENLTGRNAFALFGGVPQLTVVRDGRLRCQGAFAHSILAGCFWAAILPLIVAGFWANRRRRALALAGSLSAGVIIVCCASSTPIGAVLNASVAACLFPWRRSMRRIRWGILGALILLHLVMQAPVWHLLSRVQLVGGSTAWHRFNVIDQAVRHFGDWWLLGLSAGSSIGVSDITNQYVLEGLRGGFLTMLLFFVVVVLAFQGVGRLWRAVERDRARVALAWALGVSLWVHCVSFLGVSYFGQIFMVWYLTLALIGSLVLTINPVYVGTRVRETPLPVLVRPIASLAGPASRP